MEVKHREGEFFVEESGKKAILNYRITNSKMDIFHTFTDPELRGRGLAEKLTQAAFEYAKRNGLKIIPTCPYVSEKFLKDHEEWRKFAV